MSLESGAPASRPTATTTTTATAPPTAAADLDEDEFFDMEDEAAAADAAEQATPSVSVTTPAPTNPGAVVARRTTLPADMFDRSNVSLWTVIKDFVGKDLSKIAVPVYFNEPLSFLQKFSEDVEYHYLLDEASRGTLHINILYDRSVATADQGFVLGPCAEQRPHQRSVWRTWRRSRSRPTRRPRGRPSRSTRSWARRLRCCATTSATATLPSK